ncbi:unnamed protein product [Parnassius apollo]|uniref:(apollo) hypothetical protein n=1 Tax=Parnassius apollo TaxID=110799 RepID=A0A8S3X1R1_PARAO|nr:unnamed protein product [Parnassius apollo]
MKYSARLIYLLIIYYVLNFGSTINGEERKPSGTKIIETIHDVSGSSNNLNLKLCSEEESSDVLEDETGSRMAASRILTQLTPNIYSKQNEKMLHNKDFKMAPSPSSIDSQPWVPRRENLGMLGLMNGRIHPKLFAVRYLPPVVPVYLSPTDALSTFRENTEQINYNPDIHTPQNTILLPVNITPERTLSSDEEFWAELSQDAIMKNLIPTMEVPMPRNPYDQYKQVFRAPYPVSATDMNSDEFLIAHYPENQSRDCAFPFLASCNPTITLGSMLSDDYGGSDNSYSRAVYRRETVTHKPKSGE